MCNDCTHCRVTVQKELKHARKELPELSEAEILHLVKQVTCDECEHCTPVNAEMYACVRDLVKASKGPLTPEHTKLIGYELNRLAFRVPVWQRAGEWL